MNWTKPLAVVLLALLAISANPLAIGHFSRDVPAIVPSVDGWMRISGDLEFARPRLAVRYDFFVNPERPVIYEVVRYRVTEIDAAGATKRGNEKLQWDRDGRDLRRFECIPATAAEDACAWREMDKGGDQYRDEVALLLSLYDAHNRKSKQK